MLQTDTRLNAITDRLRDICGPSFVVTDPFALQPYEQDETMNLRYPFDVLVTPGSVAEISAIMKVCQQERIPVTPRGGGSGVTGGALPVNGGVVLLMARLNSLVELNTVDGYVIAEAGMITKELCNIVEAAGLFFPVTPTSYASSMLGGNVAENAGSIYSCRYGTTADYVLNLEVVLPDGDIIWTSANVSKNATGIPLTGLFVGSEGILGIITKVVYRLLPLPAYSAVLLAAFDDLETACNAVKAIRQSGLSPAAGELICENAIRLTAAHMSEQLPLVKPAVKAHLLLEWKETSEALLDNALELVSDILEGFTREELLLGTTASEKDRLWQLRRNIGHAMTSQQFYYRDVDVCIPPSKLFEYIVQVEQICGRHHLRTVCFGHAMNGNLHTMILMERQADDGQELAVGKALNEIYGFAIQLGGVISGEHGIGLLQKAYMPLQFPAVHMQLFRKLKALFDPHNILNPGKVI